MKSRKENALPTSRFWCKKGAWKKNLSRAGEHTTIENCEIATSFDPHGMFGLAMQKCPGTIFDGTETLKSNDINLCWAYHNSFNFGT